MSDKTKIGGALSGHAVGGLAVILLALSGLIWPLAATSTPREVVYGAFGPESPRLREQLWMLPSGEADIALRGTLFRPEDRARENARYPLVVINHGTSELTRQAVSLPTYYWLSRWFVERGYAVLLPQRRGHGATGGALAESVGTCANPNHYRSGLIAAEDIAAAVKYMAQQPFIDAGNVIVIGISTGGWASLALASQTPPVARAVINIAGGRGGHAGGIEGAVCGEKHLVEAARTFASTSRIPTLWLYSENDSYFGPDLAQAMAAAWTDGGGLAELRLLPAYRDDGHKIADDRAGWDLWGEAVERFLNSLDGEAEVAQKPLVPAEVVPTKAMAAGAMPEAENVSGESSGGKP